MEYTLKNDALTVKISDHGAEVTSVVAHRCEYLWNADPTYWNRHAPLMFPICGRLFGGKYTYRKKTYEMNPHGFLRDSDLTVKAQTATMIRMELKSNPETKKRYPFDFKLTVTHKLNGNELQTKMEVRNEGEDVLPVTFGGHPGFCVPLGSKGNFDDWYLEFSEECSPDHLLFSDTCFQTGKKKPLPLESSKILRLSHSLFDNDAIFTSRTPGSVTLKSDKSARFVTLKSKDFPYLGLWHKPKTDAPYVCIEPWCGLPSFDGNVDDLETKSDLFRVQPGSRKAVSYTVVFG